MGRARHRKAATSIEQPVANAPATPQGPWPLYLAWTLVILFYLIVRVQVVDVPLDRDEGVFGSIGQAILRGELPYHDFFDHKPPGLYLVFTVIAGLLPPTAASVHAFLHGWNFLALVALAYVAWKLAGPAAACWTAFLYSLASILPSVQGFTATAEIFAIAPIAASLALAAGAAGERRRDLLLVAAGVLAGFAFLIKPLYALPLLSTPWLFHAVAPGRWKRDVAWWIGGGALVGAAVVLFFSTIGAWREFWYWNATHNVLYRGRSWDAGWSDRLSVVARLLVPDVLVPFALAVIGCVCAIRKRERYGRFLALFLALSIVSCFQTGYFMPHYFAQTAAAIALAGGIGAAAVIRSAVRNPPARYVGVALLAALVVAVPVASKPWYWIAPNPIEVSWRMLGPQAFEASPLVAEHLKERTRPSDTVWMFANEPQITYMAERVNVNPYFLMYPMWSGYPRTREFQVRTWKAVQAAKPAYIVIARASVLMLRVPDADRFLDERLQELQPAYALESCLSVGRDRLELHTSLENTNRRCPGQTALELWRRR